MPLRFGQYLVHQVRDGTYALDGGAMFGVVPRTLWSRHLPPDEENRIRLALRWLLIEDGQRRVLVDVGIGAGWDERLKERYGIDQAGYDLDRELARAKVTREEITDVVLTHLHFDHAGGTSRTEGGDLTLAFPNATFHLQRRHWRWAHQPSEKDAASFRPEDFVLLEKSGRLHLLEGATELYPGIELFLSEGHTVGLQLVRVEGEDNSLIFCGDLVPTTAHLRASWVMAYDLYPLTSAEEKKLLLAEAVENRSVLFFEHDPEVAACTVKEEDGNVVVDQVLSL